VLSLVRNLASLHAHTIPKERLRWEVLERGSIGDPFWEYSRWENHKYHVRRRVFKGAIEASSNLRLPLGEAVPVEVLLDETAAAATREFAELIEADIRKLDQIYKLGDFVERIVIAEEPRKLSAMKIGGPTRRMSMAPGLAPFAQFHITPTSWMTRLFRGSIFHSAIEIELPSGSELRSASLAEKYKYRLQILYEFRWEVVQAVFALNRAIAARSTDFKHSISAIISRNERFAVFSAKGVSIRPLLVILHEVLLARFIESTGCGQPENAADLLRLPSGRYVDIEEEFRSILSSFLNGKLSSQPLLTQATAFYQIISEALLLSSCYHDAALDFPLDLAREVVLILDPDTKVVGIRAQEFKTAMDSCAANVDSLDPFASDPEQWAACISPLIHSVAIAIAAAAISDAGLAY